MVLHGITDVKYFFTRLLMTFLSWCILCTSGANECSLFNKHLLHSMTSTCETKHNWHVSCCSVSTFKEWCNTLLTDLALPEIDDMLCIYILHTKDGHNTLDTTLYHDSLWNQTCPVIFCDMHASLLIIRILWNTASSYTKKNYFINQ